MSNNYFDNINTVEKLKRAVINKSGTLRGFFEEFKPILDMNEQVFYDVLAGKNKKIRHIKKICDVFNYDFTQIKECEELLE